MKTLLKKIWLSITEPKYSFLFVTLMALILVVFADLMFLLGNWMPSDSPKVRTVEIDGEQYIQIVYQYEPGYDELD